MTWAIANRINLHITSPVIPVMAPLPSPFIWDLFSVEYDGCHLQYWKLCTVLFGMYRNHLKGKFTNYLVIILCFFSSHHHHGRGCYLQIIPGWWLLNHFSWLNDTILNSIYVSMKCASISRKCVVYIWLECFAMDSYLCRRGLNIFLMIFECLVGWILSIVLVGCKLLLNFVEEILVANLVQIHGLNW